MPAGLPNRETLLAGQLESLRTLLGEVVGINAFQTRKLAGTGLTDSLGSIEEFIGSAPFTTKEEIVADQRAHPPYGSNLTHPLANYTRFHQTSGTGGSPMPWLDTPRSWDAMAESWMEVHRAAGVTAADRVFFAFSFGPFLGFWLAFESAERLGCLCIPAGGLSTAARVRMLLAHRATVVCCTPTYALRMAEVARQEGLRLDDGCVRTLILAGEPGASIPAIRQRIESLWAGAKPFDHHGMTEVGPVTFECPGQPGVLHVIESAFLPEIIDPASGEAVPPGHCGELVLTTLRRTGSPLLRYRTGDLVKARLRETPSSPCVCGRHDLALEGGIMGRVDDMVVVRGVNVFPSAIEEIIRSQSGVAEYRVTVSTRNAMTELSIEVEPSAELAADASSLAARLQKALQESLSLRIPVKTAPAGTLPRFEHKARRWRRAEG